MPGDVSDTWDLSPEEERQIESAISLRGCGFTLGLVAVLIVVLAFGAFFVLRKAANDVGGLALDDGCVTLQSGGAIRFVDRAAPMAPTALPVASTTSLLVTGPAIADSVALIALDGRQPTQTELIANSGASIDPSGRYLVVYESATRQLVVDLPRRRTVAEITGDTAEFFFTAPGRGVVFFGTTSCRFLKARRVDFGAETSSRFDVRGIRDGIQPVARIGQDLIVDHVVAGGSAPTADGVSRIDLRTGRAVQIAVHGHVETVIQDPARIWISTIGERGVVVTDLQGHQISVSNASGVAASTSGRRVAYTAPVTPRDEVVRIGAADGPSSSDSVLPTHPSPYAVIAGPGADDVIVVWINYKKNVGGYDLCNQALLTCTTLLQEAYYPLLEDPIGILRTPITLR